MSFDILAVAEVLRQAAKAEIMPRFRRLADSDIRTKSEPADMVTEGDIAAEAFLRREFGTLMPEAQFIGEESIAADPALLETIFDAELAVMVDPIDGTTNFVAGVPLFGVMATLTRRGEAVAGILYDPFADDFVLAEKGSGAFVTAGKDAGRRVKVAEPVPLAEMVGFASTGFLPAQKRPRILENLDKVRMFANYRCAAHEYRSFSTGHGQFMMYSKLNPWDHMAGTLIAVEAGAHVACFDGTPYDATKRDGGLLLATSEASWDALMGNVFSV